MPKAYLLVAGDFVKTGGMDRANHALAAALATRDAEVHLVAYRADDELLALPNVHFHRVPKIVRSYLLSGPLLARIGEFWASRLTARGGRVIVNGGNCRWGDVNWVHFIHAAYAAGTTESLLKRWKGRRDRKREKTIIPLSPLVITTTERNKTDLTSRLQLPASQIQVVSLGVDPQLFRPASDEQKSAARAALGLPATGPILAFLGSPKDPRKGFDTLLTAWTELCGDPAWDVHLAVAGTGADGVAPGPRIQWLGFLPGAQSLLAAADALIAPSRYEPYSIAAHEALCCGLPVFITDCSGIAASYPPELRHWLLSSPPNASELVRRLRDWRANRDVYARQVSAFGTRLRSFTWKDMAERIIELMEAPSRSC